jgi:hypothetical protein
MATTLFGHSHWDMRNFYSTHGTENSQKICLNEVGTELWIQELGKDPRGIDSIVLEWTSSMLQIQPGERPTAAQLRGTILDSRSDFDYICHECSTKSSVDKCAQLRSRSAKLPTDELLVEHEATRDPSSRQSLDASTQATSKAQEEEPLPLYTEVAVPHLPQSPSERHEDVSTEPGVKLDSKPAERHVKFADIENTRRNKMTQSPDHQHGFSHFAGLPEDRRPKPAFQGSDDENEVDVADMVVRPEPLKPPTFRRRDCKPIPQASFVPSYILAGTNHLSKTEMMVATADPTSCNVFVYGRLMFPSVLHAIASQSIDGVYAPDLQRRIFPLSSDWGKANFSIQRASEVMTPALLRGYDRWQPSGFDCAAIQHSSDTPEILGRRQRAGQRQINPPGEVVGHLIVGIKMEAVRYLDLLFAYDEKNLKGTRPAKQEEGKESSVEVDSPLRGEMVNVEVELITGEITTVDAYTYVWRRGTAGLTRRWKEDRFVSGHSFQSLVGTNTEWRAEEQALASTMKISYSLLGDSLCAAVIAGDMEELEDLIDGGCDPDAPCRVYGTALQAAVVVGNEDMAVCLIEDGADVNASGGQYGNALIAAAYGSRKSITRMLLRKGADVFLTDPVHVNALYQAVGHSDYAIAEMLLEHAAWLVEDWGEICDLADELNDVEIQTLLRRYDVRKMHREDQRSKRREGRELEVERHSSSNVLMQVAKKCVVVQSMSGNWKGRKGVAVAVTALNAGASLSILPLLRKAVNPVNVVIRELRRMDTQEQRDDNFVEYTGRDRLISSQPDICA